MVVVDVIELRVLYGIKLDSEDIIPRVAIIRGIKKAKKVASRSSRENSVGTKHKCKTITTDLIVRPHDGENKRCGEGCHGGAI